MKKEGVPALLWRSPGLLQPRTVLRPLDWLGAGPSWASNLSWSGRHGPHPLSASVVWLYDAFKLLGAGSSLEMVTYQEHRAHTPHRVSTARRGWVTERAPRAPRLGAETTLLSEAGARRAQPKDSPAQALTVAPSRRITPAPEVDWTAPPRRKVKRNPVAEPASRPVIRWSEPEVIAAKSPSFSRTPTTGERTVPQSPPWGAPELVTASPTSAKPEADAPRAPRPQQTATTPRQSPERRSSQPSLQPRQPTGTPSKNADKTPRAARTPSASQPPLARRQPVRVEGRRKLRTLSWQRPETPLRLPLAAPPAEVAAPPGRAEPVVADPAPPRRASQSARRDAPVRRRVPTVRWSEPEVIAAKSSGFTRTPTTGERTVPQSPPWGAPELVTASPTSAKPEADAPRAPRPQQTATTPRQAPERRTSQPSLQPRQPTGTSSKNADKTPASRGGAPRSTQPGPSPRTASTPRTSQPPLARRQPVRVEGRRKLRTLSWQRPETPLRLPLAAPPAEPVSAPSRSSAVTADPASPRRASQSARRDAPVRRRVPTVRWSEPEVIAAKSSGFTRTPTTGERTVPQSPPWGAPELVTASPTSAKPEADAPRAPRPQQTATTPRQSPERRSSQPSLQPRQPTGTPSKNADKTPRAARTPSASQPPLARRQPVRVEGRRKLRTLSWQRPETPLRLPLAAPPAEPVSAPSRSSAVTADPASPRRASQSTRRDALVRRRVPTVRWSEPEVIAAKSSGFTRTPTTGERTVPQSPPWGAPELVTASPTTAKPEADAPRAPRPQQTATTPRQSPERRTSQPSLQPRQPVRVEGRQKLRTLSWQRPEAPLRLPLAAPPAEPVSAPSRSSAVTADPASPRRASQSARRDAPVRRRVPTVRWSEPEVIAAKSSGFIRTPTTGERTVPQSPPWGAPELVTASPTSAKPEADAPRAPRPQQTATTPRQSPERRTSQPSLQPRQPVRVEGRRKLRTLSWQRPETPLRLPLAAPPAEVAAPPGRAEPVTADPAPPRRTPLSARRDAPVRRRVPTVRWSEPEVIAAKSSGFIRTPTTGERTVPQSPPWGAPELVTASPTSAKPEADAPRAPRPQQTATTPRQSPERRSSQPSLQPRQPTGTPSKNADKTPRAARTPSASQPPLARRQPVRVEGRRKLRTLSWQRPEAPLRLPLAAPPAEPVSAPSRSSAVTADPAPPRRASQSARRDAPVRRRVPTVRWSEPEVIAAKSSGVTRTPTTGERTVPQSPPWGAPELVTASPTTAKPEADAPRAPRPQQTATTPRQSPERRTSQPSLQPRQPTGTPPKNANKTPRAARTPSASQPPLARRQPVRVEGRRKLRTLSWQRPETPLRLPLAAPSTEPVSVPVRAAQVAAADVAGSPRRSGGVSRDSTGRPQVPTIRWSEPVVVSAKAKSFEAPAAPAAPHRRTSATKSTQAAAKRSPTARRTEAARPRRKLRELSWQRPDTPLRLPSPPQIEALAPGTARRQPTEGTATSRLPAVRWDDPAVDVRQPRKTTAVSSTPELVTASPPAAERGRPAARARRRAASRPQLHRAALRGTEERRVLKARQSSAAAPAAVEEILLADAAPAPQRSRAQQARPRRRLGLRSPSRTLPGRPPDVTLLGLPSTAPTTGAEPAFLITPRRESGAPSRAPSPPPNQSAKKKVPKAAAKPPREKKALASWQAPQAGPEQPSSSSQVWRAPEPMKKPAKQKTKIVRKESGKRVRRQDVEPAVFEELTEQEILVVLEALSTQSTEARQLLNDVLRRIDDLRRFDTLRQI